MDNSVSLVISRKLGIASNDVIRKAKELQRVVEVRCGSSLASLNLSNTASTVLCLEIAANTSGISVCKVFGIYMKTPVILATIFL